MARILLVRHGEAHYESEVINDEGGSLTAQGRRQSHELGLRLATAGVVGLWTSPMSRAVQTTEIVASHLGTDAVAVRVGLTEYSVGDFAGRPSGSYHLFRAVFDAWLGGDHTAHIPGGEVIDDVGRRMVDTLDEVADAVEAHAASDQAGLGVVVAHGGVIGIAVTVLGRDLPAFFTQGRRLLNCAGVELERGTDRSWRVLSWGGAPVADLV